MNEFEHRLGVCLVQGHHPVMQRARRGQRLLAVYFCSHCGCGLVQTRLGQWQVREAL